jgi:site-specific recombinase XerD
MNSPEWDMCMLGYVNHRSRAWREHDRLFHDRSLLANLSAFSHAVNLTRLADLTPRVWFAYVQDRIKKGIKPSSLNTELKVVQSLLRFAKENGTPISETMLEVHLLKVGEALPKDLNMGQVKALLDATQNPMDRVWILLMLHCGLRTCEVRTLRWEDVDLQKRILYVRESKGLQSRVVFLSQPVRETLGKLPQNQELVFTYRNKPLSRRYCQSRLVTIGTRCGFHVTPHQLRHTCATMLLNAGMSVLGVQKLLGHKYVETTLRYARAYDVTVVRDIQRANESGKKVRQIARGVLPDA